jgi:hypothetical protein
LVQTKTLEDLSLDEEAQKGDAQKKVEFLLWHFVENTSLEFGPKTWNRQEYRGSAAVEVSNKGGKGLGKEKVVSRNQWDALWQ